MRNIICLVGESGAGKSTVTLLLKKRGFASLSISNEVRKYVAEQGIEKASRVDMQVISRQARPEFGAGYFAKLTMQNYNSVSENNVVIDGLRHPAELEEIKQSINAEDRLAIFAILANPELRFQRILTRQDESDPQTYEQFLTNGDHELGINNDELAPQIANCIALADFRIENNTTLENLQQDLDLALHHYNMHPEGKHNINQIER